MEDILAHFEGKKHIYLTWYLLIIPFIVLCIGFIGFSSDKNIIRVLKESGMTVTATVNEVKKSGFTHPGTDSVTVNYMVDGKEYTVKVLTEAGKQHVGDKMILLCSKDDPSTASTEEHFEYWMKTRKVELIIMVVLFYVFFFLWYRIVILPRRNKRRRKREMEEMHQQLLVQQYGIKVDRNQQGDLEVHTSNGTFTRNPNKKRKSESQQFSGNQMKSKKRKK